MRLAKKGANVSEEKTKVGTDINICRGLIGFGSTTIPWQYVMSDYDSFALTPVWNSCPLM